MRVCASTHILILFSSHLYATHLMTEKQLIYQQNITRSLGELYQHMEIMLDCIPDDNEVRSEELSEHQLEVLERIDAIEQEWILDPVTRAECSMIRWDENKD